MAEAGSSYEVLIPLAAGPIPSGDMELLPQVKEFQPLDREAGRKAAEWLRVNFETGTMPLDTFLVFDGEMRELLGFFVLDKLEVAFARADQPILEVRDRSLQGRKLIQATKLVWIARSRGSAKGFGSEMFDQVLVRAIESGSAAVVMEPFDDETAHDLWKIHFECRHPRADSTSSECLEDFMWHSLGDPPQEFG